MKSAYLCDGKACSKMCAETMTPEEWKAYECRRNRKYDYIPDDEDGCGKFYSNGSSEQPIAQNAMDVVDAYGNERHIMIIDWFRDKRIDLCMDCSVDLKYWWKEGQAVKEEE